MQSFDELFILFGILGALGASAIILVYIFAPSTRCQSRQLLLWLSVADLLQSLFFCAYLGDSLQDHTVCLVHSVIGIVGAASSFFWTACMAYYVNFSVQYPGVPMARSLVIFFHVLSWGYPLATAFAMISNSDINYTYPVRGGRLGWFSCYEPSPAWTAVHFELPLFVCWVFTLVMYTKAQGALKEQVLPSRISSEALQELRTKFLLVPLIFIFLRLWAFVDLLLIFAFPQPEFPLHSWFSLLIHLRGICDPLQGFCNAVVFIGMNPIVWHRAKQELFGPASQPVIIQAPPCLPMNPAPSSYNTFGESLAPIGSEE